MKVSVSIKTLFVLNQIMMQNPELARQVTSLAPEGELPLAELCDCLDKVTSQLIELESLYFGISLQAASARVKEAVVSGKFYTVRKITNSWVPECLEGKPIVSLESGEVIKLSFDDRTKLDQYMFDRSWVFVPEHLL